MGAICRSYIGVTAHWISTKNFERESCALACQRIRGSQTGEVFAQRLDGIIKLYGLTDKVWRIVTDGGSNFIKACSEVLQTPDTVLDAQTDAEVDADVDADVDAGQKEDGDEGKADVDVFTPILIGDSLDVFGAHLPRREGCSARKLNLMASTDVGSCSMDVTYNMHYESLIGKLKNLWTKQNRSSRIADAIKEKVGRYFLVPVATRWNSLIDALQVVMHVMKEKQTEFLDLLTHLQLPRFTEDETLFLNEYVRVNIIMICIEYHFHSSLTS